MTNAEFSNEFDILYNSITPNQAPGLDEYEKNDPRFPSPSIAPVLKPTAEVMEKIGKLKK